MGVHQNIKSIPATVCHTQGILKGAWVSAPFGAFNLRFGPFLSCHLDASDLAPDKVCFGVEEKHLLHIPCVLMTQGAFSACRTA